MSLLHTKSWNPRSAKNRARVERAEAEAKAEQRRKTENADLMEAEWRYERLKAAKQAAMKRETGDGAPSMVSEARQTGNARSGHEVASDRPHPSEAARPPRDAMLGGQLSQDTPWYAKESYDMGDKVQFTASAKNSTELEDPLRLMSRKDGDSTHSSSKRMKMDDMAAFSKKQHRTDPLSADANPSRTFDVMAKLREDRLRREQAEKDRADQLLGKRKPQMNASRSRGGPIRGST